MGLRRQGKQRVVLRQCSIIIKVYTICGLCSERHFEQKSMKQVNKNILYEEVGGVFDLNIRVKRVKVEKKGESIENEIILYIALCRTLLI